MCPVKVRRVDGYRVTHDGTVSAKSTTHQKAQAQASLLRGVAHGFKPTGKKKARTYKPPSAKHSTSRSSSKSRGSRSRSKR